MTTPPTISHLIGCFDSLEALFGGLDDDQWSTPSLCPGWTVRDVAVHLAGAEHMLAGQSPESMAEGIPFGRAIEFASQAQDLTDAEVLDRFREVIAGRRVELAALGDQDLAAPSMTPVGPGTFGSFLEIRVFDCWVHEQDVRVPLGMSGHESGPAAEVAMGQITSALPYIVGKKIGLADGASITFDIGGAVPRVVHLRVDGRAGVVDHLDAPDVVLRADSLTFALLACGRIDPQGPIDDGRVTWEGDAEVGDRAARNLAFTM